MSKKQKGILFIILSALCFSLMNMFVKLSGDLPSIQKSFFRNSVAVVAAAVLLVKSHTPFRWQKGNLGLLVVRASFGTLGILCNFYAISHMNLADASMLNKLSPFFVILFSFFFLKEKVTLFQTGAMTAAFVGSMFIIRPGFQFQEALPAVIGFLGGLAAGALHSRPRLESQRGKESFYRILLLCLFLPRDAALPAFCLCAHERPANALPSAGRPICLRGTVCYHGSLCQRTGKRYFYL